MKFREGIKEKNVIIRCGADKFLPFALTSDCMSSCSVPSAPAEASRAA